jgi:hypothetical protein
MSTARRKEEDAKSSYNADSKLTVFGIVNSSREGHVQGWLPKTAAPYFPQIGAEVDSNVLKHWHKA